MTYVIRLIGSFHTITIQGRSGRTSSEPVGWSTSTSDGWIEADDADDADDAEVEKDPSCVRALITALPLWIQHCLDLHCPR